LARGVRDVVGVLSLPFAQRTRRENRGRGRLVRVYKRAAGRHARQSPCSQRARDMGAMRRWLVRGLRWVFMNTASGYFGTLVTGLLLARMMGPAELGVFGISVVSLVVARSIAGLGMSRAIAGWHGDPGEILPTAMTISLVAGIAVYAGCYAGAPALSAAMGAPGAASPVRLLSLSVIIGGAVVGPRGTLQRRAPGSRVMVDQVGNCLAVTVSIALTAAGFGLMSFAVGQTVGCLVSAGLLVALAPRSFRFGFRRHQSAGLLGAALPFAASSVLICAITSVGLIVVGVLLHPRLLGLYVLALCCASWPATVLSNPVGEMAAPALARFRRSPEVAGSVFTASVRLIASLTLPACIFLASSAEPLVQVLYGSAWVAAARVLIWLAPLAVLRVFYDVVHDYLAVLVSSRRLLAFQVIWLIVLTPALVAGTRLAGLAGVAMAEFAVAAVVLSAWYLIELRPTAVKPGWKDAWLRMPLAAAVGVTAFGTLRLTHDKTTELVIGGAITLAVTVLLIYRMLAVLDAVRQAAASAAARPLAAVAPLQPASTVPKPQPAISSATSSLGARIHLGARWSMLNSIVMRVSGSLVSIILARTVFGPRVWGLYAVSQIVLTVLLSTNDLGLCAAIVRWDGNVRTAARTVLTLSVAVSVVLYAGVYVAAPDIARMLGSPDATWVVRVLCLCLIINAVSGPSMSLLQREFAQRRQMLVDSINFLVSTGVMLWLAFTGHGAMSFAWGAVAGCAVATVMLLVYAPVVPGWRISDVRGLLRFGLPLAGASLLMLGVFTVDSAIVGAALGAIMLGFYQLAFNISNWPLTVISQAATRVSFAGFSRVAGSRQRLTDGFTHALAVLMALTIPACVLLATLAEPLIQTVYGPKWTPAAPTLTLLAILGILRVAYTLVYDYLAADGKRHQLMWTQALWLGALIPALLIGARTHGIVGVGAGHLLVALAVVGPIFLWGLARTGVSPRSILAACSRPLVGGVLMAVASLLVIHMTGAGLAGLAAAIVAGFAAYLPVVLPMRVLLRVPQLETAPAELNEASAA
jgi:O-antigen/teichoic acid export membrane protein